MTIKVMLDDIDFDLLIRGKVVELTDSKGVVGHMALQDIGYDKMLQSIWEAMRERGDELDESMLDGVHRSIGEEIDAQEGKE